MRLRSPGEGNDYPLQYSGLENSSDCTGHGATKSCTQLRGFHSLLYSLNRPGVSKGCVCVFVFFFLIDTCECIYLCMQKFKVSFFTIETALDTRKDKFRYLLVCDKGTDNSLFMSEASHSMKL